MPLFVNKILTFSMKIMEKVFPLYLFFHQPWEERFFFQEELKKHFRVIFPDLSGHGDTVAPFKTSPFWGMREK